MGPTEKGVKAIVTAFMHALTLRAETASWAEAFSSVGSFRSWSIIPSENPLSPSNPRFYIPYV